MFEFLDTRSLDSEFSTSENGVGVTLKALPHSPEQLFIKCGVAKLDTQRSLVSLNTNTRHRKVRPRVNCEIRFQ